MAQHFSTSICSSVPGGLNKLAAILQMEFYNVFSKDLISGDYTDLL